MKIAPIIKSKLFTFIILLIITVGVIIVGVKSNPKLGEDFTNLKIIELTFNQQQEQSKLIEQISAKYGKVDILHNQAGLIFQLTHDWDNATIKTFKADAKKTLTDLNTVSNYQQQVISPSVFNAYNYRIVLIIAAASIIFIVIALRELKLRIGQIITLIFSDILTFVWEISVTVCLVIALSGFTKGLEHWIYAYAILILGVLAALKMYSGYLLIDFIKTRKLTSITLIWQQFIRDKIKQIGYIYFCAVVLLILPLVSLLEVWYVVIAFISIVLSMISTFILRGTIINFMEWLLLKLPFKKYA